MACAGIPDRNLRLALLDAVRSRRGGYWFEDLRADYEALGVEPGWEALDEYMDPLPALEELIAALPVTPAQLAGIRSLTLDGDRDVYACFPDWWQIEPDHYVIRNLSGIEQCTNLEYLSLGQGLVHGASLLPVSRLPNLRELSVCALCDHRDITAITALPLQRLSVVNAAHHLEWQYVIGELAEAGVSIG